ncbi:LOW QUALITY PROTEIN: steroid 17-alpha-hydroxylase/17,20 lyase isoform X2 [Hydra vulgaris]|uniref:LOW QUALITY PROTEIN: steroid 17-alpha-hydroxylase/17,20 lyase isoform X2 n=1 Tax=Hydra vulgaris TaxID=6087 RepID=A0ABM4BJZ4_HYDVU
MLFQIVCGLIAPLLLYIIGSYCVHLLECKKYPPGPIPIPVLGNLHLLGAESHKTLALYSKKYGNVFSISFGMHRLVIISDITATREALVQKATIFAGRSKSYVAQFVTRGYKDIAFMDYGPLWKFAQSWAFFIKDIRRRMRTFRKVTYKKELHKRILDKSNSPMELKTEFGVAILNVICFIVFGERYQYSDPAFIEILTIINNIAAGLSNTTAVDFLPGLRYLQFSEIKKLKSSLVIYFRLLNDQLKKHKETFDENNIRDFTDSIIKFSKDETMENKFEEELTDEHLEHVIGDMFVAGSEITLTSLLWLIIYMIHYPKYQEEIFEEITRVIGENRYPQLSDRDSLHLVKASIKECLRLSSIVPLGIPHKTMSETTLIGYNIPKYTTVIINHWQIHIDTNHWKNPNEFNPRRWIDDDNNLDATRATSYLPFSAGTRVCLGKTVAETELFFFFTRLIRDFKFEGVPGCPLPSLIGKCSIALAPEEFDVHVTPRINSLMFSENILQE